MTTFYLGAFALTVLAVVFAVWPYLRRAKTEATNGFVQERQATNVASFRDHVLELDTQFKQGNIEQAQYDETKTELERGLLHDNNITVSSQTAITAGKAKLLYWVLVFIALPATVFYLYQMLGFKDSVTLSEIMAQKNALEQEWLRTGNVELEQPLVNTRQSLLIGLEKHIDKHPEDLDSHVLLAREAVSVGLYDKAIEAYQVILEQEPTAVQIMAELAQTVFVQAGNQAVPVVGILAERAIEIQPDHVMALGLAGISAFQNADYPKAITHWQRAISLQPQNSANAQALANGIDQARARLANTTETKAETANTTAESESVGEPSLTVTVSLGDKVATKPDAAVFIYARAWQGAKIPLAISRVTVSELPLTVTLDNSLSMAPGMNLSTTEQVELIARVSESGGAISQEGDWQVSLGPIAVATSSEQAFELVIDTPYQP